MAGIVYISVVRVGYKRGYNPTAKDINTIAVCAGSGNPKVCEYFVR